MWMTLAADQEAAAVNHLQTKLNRLPKSVLVPVLSERLPTVDPLATISAAAVLVTDAQTGTQLYRRQDGLPRVPASTVKMMTALVARQLYDLDQVLTVREEAFADGSVTGFVVGEQLTVRQLLAALLIHSGNDAAFVLANNAPGGYTAFIAAMNKEAVRLGLTGTTFANASGLDSDRQLTTAVDLTKLGEAVLADPVLAAMVQTPSTTVVDVTGSWRHPIQNRNELIGRLPGVVGIKTGTTLGAGENLVAAVEQANRRTYYVLLGSQNRFGETVQLVNWVNQEVRWRELIPPHWPINASP